MIKDYPANAAQHIGHHIQDISMSEGNEILMNFIADPVKGCRCNAYKNQKFIAVFERQGVIGPVKQDTQQGIGPKMQEFIQKSHVRHALGPG